jgi:hypothetical protein
MAKSGGIGLVPLLPLGTDLQTPKDAQALLAKYNSANFRKLSTSNYDPRLIELDSYTETERRLAESHDVVIQSTIRLRKAHITLKRASQDYGPVAKFAYPA